MTRSIATALLLVAATLAAAVWLALREPGAAPTSSHTPPVPAAVDTPPPTGVAPDRGSARAPGDASRRAPVDGGVHDELLGISVSGRFVRADGRPAALQSFSLHFGRRGVSHGTTDAAGAFSCSVQGVRAGEPFDAAAAFLHAEPGQSAPDAASLEVSSLDRGDNALGDLVVAPPPVLVAGTIQGVTKPSDLRRVHLAVEARAGERGPWRTLRTFADWPNRDDELSAERGRPFVIRGAPAKGQRHRLVILPADFDTYGRGAVERFAAVPFEPGQQDLLVTLPDRGTLRVLVVPSCAEADLRLLLWPDSSDQPLRPTARGAAGAWASTRTGIIRFPDATEPAIAADWARLPAGRYRLEVRALGSPDAVVSETIDFVADQGNDDSSPFVYRIDKPFSELQLEVLGAAPRMALVTPGEPATVRMITGSNATVHGLGPMDFDLVSPGRAAVRLRGVMGPCTVSLPPARTVELRLPAFDANSGWAPGWRGELVVEAIDPDGHYARTVRPADSDAPLGELLGTTHRFALGRARLVSMPAPPGGALRLTVRAWREGAAPMVIPLEGPARLAVDALAGPITVVPNRDAVEPRTGR